MSVCARTALFLSRFSSGGLRERFGARARVQFICSRRGNEAPTYLQPLSIHLRLTFNNFMTADERSWTIKKEVCERDFHRCLWSLVPPNFFLQEARASIRFRRAFRTADPFVCTTTVGW